MTSDADLSGLPKEFVADVDIDALAKRHQLESAHVASALIAMAVGHLVWIGGRDAAASVVANILRKIVYRKYDEPNVPAGRA